MSRFGAAAADARTIRPREPQPVRGAGTAFAAETASSACVTASCPVQPCHRPCDASCSCCRSTCSCTCIEAHTSRACYPAVRGSQQLQPRSSAARAVWLPVLLYVLLLVLQSDRTAALAPDAREAKCDISTGYWRFSPTKFPRYSGRKGSRNECKYMRSTWNCDANGRHDRWYQYYRWQPRNCTMQYFLTSGFRWMMRGKKMLIIGDSLMTNMYEALICLLDTGGYEMRPLKQVRINGKGPFRGYYIPRFKFQIYYLFSAYLRDAQKDRRRREEGKRGGHFYRVNVDKIDPNLAGALPFFDVVVMSSGRWWMQNVPGRTQRNQFFVNGQYRELDNVNAYGLMLRSLVQHIRSVDYKGIPFFISIPPMHKARSNVPARTQGVCRGSSTKPLRSLDSVRGDLVGSERFYKVQKESLFSTPVRLVKITRMTQRRPDAHVGRWWASPWSNVPARAAGTEDCTHWCLPGVPDFWLDLLYNHMLLEPSLMKR